MKTESVPFMRKYSTYWKRKFDRAKNLQIKIRCDDGSFAAHTKNRISIEWTLFLRFILFLNKNWCAFLLFFVFINVQPEYHRCVCVLERAPLKYIWLTKWIVLWITLDIKLLLFVVVQQQFEILFLKAGNRMAFVPPTICLNRVQYVG